MMKEDFFEVAETAYKKGNYIEAYNYYNKVIEIDVNDYKSWYGKAISASFLVKWGDLNFSETLTGIEVAIKKAPEDRKKEIIKKAGEDLFEISSNLFNNAYDLFINLVDLNSYNLFINRSTIIISLLKEANGYMQENIQVLEKISHIYETYNKSYLTTNSKETVFLLEEAKVKADEEIKEIKGKILKISPNYFTEPQKQEVEVHPRKETIKNTNKPNKKKFNVIWIILIIAIIVGIVLWNINPWYIIFEIVIVAIIVGIMFWVIIGAAAINAGRIIGNGLSDMDKKHQNEKH